ncbi:unnamed protein product [Gongylonema pulchrum]|uniref:Peptidase_M14 domain-containing protein n=1 Tax=Gongylonema pulchrum TaxID=637853 RepID=A0A183DLG2_9BILA|nr:unnamed protein product [Gongylonema pulchrum]
MLYLIAILCENYGKNKYLTNLVDNTRIHILPSMNPDGYEKGFEGDRTGYTVSCYTNPYIFEFGIFFC